MNTLLLADAGSTSTQWAIIADHTLVDSFTTSGLNPTTMGIDLFRDILCRELTPQLVGKTITHVQFFGAGCTITAIPQVTEVLRQVTQAQEVTVDSDLQAAIQAVNYHTADDDYLLAILGTGTNTAHIKGGQIVQQIPPLGYILGDEGSGTAIAKRFINALYKRRLPDELRVTFEHDTQLTLPDIIHTVYQQPNANTFLASLTKTIATYQHYPAVEQLLQETFCEFFSYNILPYHCPELPIHLVGSIAHHFSQPLHTAANQLHLHLGTITPHPIPAIILHHTSLQEKGCRTDDQPR